MAYLDPDFEALPKEWTIHPLHEVAEIHNTLRAPLNAHERESRKGIYPYCGANGVVDSIDEFRFDGEYVLIAEDGGYWGKLEPSSYIMRGKFWVNNHAHVIREKEGVSNNLFLSCLLNFMNISPLIGGDARGKLTKSILERLPMVTPPLTEQRKIATVLGVVQRAIEQQERLLALTAELKKTLLYQLFTQGLRGELQKQTEIGLVPESWEVTQLGKIATSKSGGTPSRAKPEYWDGGSIPWVKTGEVNYCVIDDSEEKITAAGLANSSAKLFPAGTLLMAMYGQGITRGKVAILGAEAATNQACVAIFPCEDVSTKFLYYFFEGKYEHIRNLGHGANQKNLSAEILKGVTVAYPKDREEQASIVSSLEGLDKKLSLHERKHSALNDLFRTLLHQLMTAQIRVHDLELPELEYAQNG